MNTRNEKRRCKKVLKRGYNQNERTIRFIWPFIKNLEGKSNDFLFIILKTLVANRALSSAYRVKQLIRGFFLKSKPDSWNTLSLTVNPESNWFDTCRECNLEILGPILGYFLRTKAQHFCQSLSLNFKPINDLNDTSNILSICDKAVIPVVVELSVAERTARQLATFAHISNDELNAVILDGLLNKNRSRKMIMYSIRHEYNNWAWSCLKFGYLPLYKNVISGSNTFCMLPMICISDSKESNTAIQSLNSRSGRNIKKRIIMSL